jgi:hypothetical protein
MTKLLLAACIITLCSLLAVSLLTLSPPSSQDKRQTSMLSSQQPPPPASFESTPTQNPPEPPPSTPATTTQTTPYPYQPPLPPNTQRPTNRTLSEAVGNATHYLSQTKEPYALLMLDVIYRRFGITEFNDSLQVFDGQLAANPPDAPIQRVFRRMADYSNSVLQPTDFYAVRFDLDRVTVPALYSDRFDLPPDYSSTFTSAVGSGGYLLTHALLATIWFQDNHYNLSLSEDFKDNLYRANAALVNGDSAVTDLELEAAAFLYLAGQGALVDEAFVQHVIAAQNYDGGWSASSDSADNSFWHTSVLGLMLLLHVEYPASSYPPMLPPAPQQS